MNNDRIMKHYNIKEGKVLLVPTIDKEPQVMTAEIESINLS